MYPMYYCSLHVHGIINSIAFVTYVHVIISEAIVYAVKSCSARKAFYAPGLNSGVSSFCPVWDSVCL